MVKSGSNGVEKIELMECVGVPLGNSSRGGRGETLTLTFGVDEWDIGWVMSRCCFCCERYWRCCNANLSPLWKRCTAVMSSDVLEINSVSNNNIVKSLIWVR